MKKELLNMKIGDIIDVEQSKHRSMLTTKTKLKSDGFGTWQSKNSLNGYQVKRTS